MFLDTISHVGGALTSVSSVLLLMRRYPGVQRIFPMLAYLYSLPAYLTGLAIYLALQTGNLSASGVPQTEFGHRLIALAEDLTDLLLELRVVMIIASIIIIPQIISYIVAGLAGYAGRVLFVNVCMRYAAISIAKSYCVAGGIQLALWLAHSMLGWNNELLGKNSDLLLLVAISSIGFSTAIFIFIEEGQNNFPKLKNLFPRQAIIFLTKIDALAKRNIGALPLG